MKCGTPASAVSRRHRRNLRRRLRSIAPMDATSLKCPNCGAPISPKFGEMVITCEYCGSGITLGNTGWTSIQKSTMLPIKFGDKDPMIAKIHDLMDKGFLHRHLQEIVHAAGDDSVHGPVLDRPGLGPHLDRCGKHAPADGADGHHSSPLRGRPRRSGRRHGRGRRRIPPPARLVTGSATVATRAWERPSSGSFMGGGMMGGGGARKAEQMDNNYNFPVVALKALTDYQPKDYVFNLTDRTLFDVSKIPKGIPILNGDVGEDDAKNQAKTFVDQVQSQKAHEKYHMIQQMHTDMDVGEAELLHAPIWFARYDHKGERIVLVFDANSGLPITSMGLN